MPFSSKHHLINVPFYQLTIFINSPFSSIHHFINVSFHQLVISSTCNFINLMFCQLANGQTQANRMIPVPSFSALDVGELTYAMKHSHKKSSHT
jgi:hypothetical protein